VVLMDIAMPEMDGLETAARMSKEFPNVKVIMLSMHAGEEYVMQALRAGASGYLLKDSAVGDIVGGIKDWEEALRLAPPEWPKRKMIEGMLERAKARLKDRNE